MKIHQTFITEYTFYVQFKPFTDIKKWILFGINQDYFN